jgi:hypothetical protein
MPPVETGTSFGTLLLGFLLLLVGIGVLALLGLVLFSACRSTFGGFFERTAFRKSSLRCYEGDNLIEQGDFAGAVQLFGDAFFLEPIRRESELLSSFLVMPFSSNQSGANQSCCPILRIIMRDCSADC